MKKFIKAVCLVLCLAVVLCGFVACGPKNSDDTHRVTFSQNYAGAPSAQIAEVKDGDKAVRPENPTREGYSFDTWYTETVGINEYVFDTAVNDDIVLFAGWNQTAAVVTFHTGAGSAVAPSNVRVGDRVGTPADPVRSGYVFAGWFTDNLYRTQYDFTAAVSEDITLYAKWTQTEATVTFSLYDDLTTSGTAAIGQKVLRPDDPTRADYAFTGWYSDPQRTTLYDFDSIVERDMILYAGWRLVSATVTYNYNYPGAPAAATAKAEVGQHLTAPEEPTREGYEFTAWYTEPALRNEYVFTENTVTDNMTLYAGWSILTYSVTFDWRVAGSTPIVQTVEHGSVAAVPEATPPTNGTLVFVGWYADADCTVEYAFGAVTGSAIVYAKWEEASSEAITITYYTNDGTTAVYHTVNNATLGMRLTAPAEPTRSGYYFAGWAIGSGDGALWNFSRNFVTGSTNLYAKWLRGYNFEAEFTDLSGKRYHGWSDDGEAQPENLVVHSSRFGNAAEMKISNGAMIWSMLYNGASLEFDITSSAAVTDAVLVLRMSPDGFDYELNDNMYQVLVNGQRLEYGHLCMPQGDEYAELEKRPLVNYVMTISLNLRQGENRIQLLTNNNNGHDGTYHAETPLVDCMTLYSTSTLSWTTGKCFPSNAGQTMADVDYAVDFEGDFDRNRDHAQCPLGNN